MKKFWAEFKAFIAKGNVVDLAIAVIIGAAFNKIVSSLVNDIIMPLISCAVGGTDVSDWKWVIKPAEYGANGEVLVAESALKYGSFIQTIIDFLIIAFTLFVIFKIFTYSKNKLEKFGKQVVDETKKLAKEQKKHWKKKKGDETEATEVANTLETNETSQETLKSNSPVETPVSIEESTPSKEDVMIELLTEIRDNLNTNKSSKNSKQTKKMWKIHIFFGI